MKEETKEKIKEILKKCIFFGVLIVTVVIGYFAVKLNLFTITDENPFLP